MDKVASKIAALGVPGLVLMVAISATGLYGGAAITTALAALGPFGILGGIATLGVVGLASEAISEFGFSAVFSGVVKQLYKQGESKRKRQISQCLAQVYGMRENIIESNKVPCTLE